MNFSAVEHIPFDNYCYPLNENKLIINLKTGKEITAVYLIEGDPFKGGLMGGNWKWSGKRSACTQKRELERHFWWTMSVSPEFKRSKYYFELHANSSNGETEIYYYLEGGFYSKEEFRNISGMIPAFVFPWMNSVDINTTPDWPRDMVWYQIFPDRFSNGNPAINSPSVKKWAKPEQQVDNEEDYGGDLQGIINRLDYLSDLGIGGLYLNPINYAVSKHKYDTIDYLKIDPLLGDTLKMKELCKEAHKRNIKIMLDGVFNHCGWYFFAWQDVLRNGKSSQYAGWFMINDYNFITKITKKNSDGYLVPDKDCGGYAYNKNYYAFAFVDWMPKLNTNNPEVIHYLLNVCEKWVTEYDIDALRLDVANEISHKFCRELQSTMRSLKRDFFIVGEIWHNSLPWLRGGEFDSVMNYPLSESIMTFWNQKELSVDNLQYAVNYCFTMYMEQTNKVLFNLMDSHDTERLITKTGNREKTLQQFTFLFGMNGSACIYYGTECLLEGGHDPDCRRCMPWDELKAGRYDETYMFFKTLIYLRKTHNAMREGTLEFIKHDGLSRLVHICKTVNSLQKKTQGIEMYFNCGSAPCKIDMEYKVLLSRGYTKGILAPDGLIVAEY
jgi:glycosidase